jgi:hypothetical protein
MNRKYCFLILTFIFIAQNLIGQDFHFYSGKNIFGESMYGQEGQYGIEIAELKWRALIDIKSSNFSNP